MPIVRAESEDRDQEDQAARPRGREDLALLHRPDGHAATILQLSWTEHADFDRLSDLFYLAARISCRSDSLIDHDILT